MPVRHVVGALLRRSEYFSPLQGKGRGLASNGVGVADASTIQWTGGVGIKPILVVVTIRARQCNVKTQSKIQCQLGSDLPVILGKKSVLIVSSGWPGLDFFFGSAIIASTVLRHLAHEEACHGIAAARGDTVAWIPDPRTRAGTGGTVIEAEEPNWSVGLYVVNLVDADVKPELDLVLAVYLVEGGR